MIVTLAVLAYLAVGFAVADTLDLIGEEVDPGIDVITVAVWPFALIGFAVGFARELLRGRG